MEAEVKLPSTNLAEDMSFFTTTLGMSLQKIYPADNPSVAVLSGHGLRIRLEKGSGVPPGTIVISTPDPDSLASGKRDLTAPNGTLVEIQDIRPPLIVPPVKHELVVRKNKEGDVPWIVGRAGMLYRDLIPSRLGGAMVASHIAIPAGGPVPDMVHYHTVHFQLIYCYRGWIDLVYEGQGPQFRLSAGQAVLQPPEIRHHGILASENLEVVEVSVPAHHMTTIDHEMVLPSGAAVDHDRKFSGQGFVYYKREEVEWKPFARLGGFDSQDTGIADATGGLANVHVLRFNGGRTDWSCHSFDACFTFVLKGSMILECEGRESDSLEAGDSFVIPPNSSAMYSQCSNDLELLEVSIPSLN